MSRLTRSDVRDSVEDAATLARLGRDLPGFLRRPLSAEQALATVRDRIENRDQHFLSLVERLVYGNPDSPYRALLRAAGCEAGDVRALVRAEGLDGALHTLAARGVYVSYEEFKGRVPVIRGSQRLRIRLDAFRNPLNRPHVPTMTSGSSGRPVRAHRSLAFLAERALTVSVALQAHNIDHPRVVFWHANPLHHTVEMSHIGVPVAQWWYPAHPLPRRARFVIEYARLLSRLGGYRIPAPRHAGLDDAGRIARALAELGRDGRPTILLGMTSAALRVAEAAATAGFGLRGVWSYTGGEPLSEARRRVIEATGIGSIPKYGSVDAAGQSTGCAAPLASDDMHVMLNQGTVIARPRPVYEGGPVVNAMLVTGISRNWPNIALNLEPGDEATVETRDCACLLGRLGLRTHLSNIRSFEKLTGEGVSFSRSSLIRILEEELPVRFGGSPLDYQATEVEAPGGTTRLVLRVSPSVGDIDEAALRATILGALAVDGGGLSAAYHARIWERAGTLDVRREAPVPTRTGKTLTFQPLQRDASPAP